MSVLLNTRRVEKVWGRSALPDPFTGSGNAKIGEIWFEPDGRLPELLVKYLFTSERLSVQVHPDDDQAAAAGLGRQGKSECWLVIAAEPDATLGVGFREPVSRDRMRDAARDGSIEDLLVWHPVRPGDFFYIPANTVHAIGAGVSLIEIQQNSDVTYRLYDYGRPRELHLDAGLAVAEGVPHDPAYRRHLPLGETLRLVAGPHFVLDRICGTPDPAIVDDYRGALLVLPRKGLARIAGEAVGVGQCAVAEDVSTVEFDPDGMALIARAGT